MSEIAIQVEDVSKRYYIGKKQNNYRTMRDTMADALASPFRRAGKLLRGQATGAAELDETIWALKDISFEVKRGEIVGIIGRNGAGKSTLLKILSRITEPTEGRANLYGRVGSLLEVGTGFHPELTGRENIYLNGAILGMGREEIERKFDEMVDFAEIEKFIDTPVKHYSSGMYVRLAFAVAAHLEPEILLVDEVLAVGDIAFQKKCLGKIGDVAHQGRTVLFVSHNMAPIRQLCTSGILLDRGGVKKSGSADECVDDYLSVASERTGSILDHGKMHTEHFRVDNFTVNGYPDDQINISAHTSSLEVEVSGYVSQTTKISIEAYLYDASKNVIAMYSPGHFEGNVKKFPVGAARIKGIIELPRLNKGEYFLDILLTDPGVMGLWSFPYALCVIAEGRMTVTGFVFENRRGKGAIVLPGKETYQSENG
jgi:lipopolysaccharide transport system ATP-binding protein